MTSKVLRYFSVTKNDFIQVGVAPLKSAVFILRNELNRNGDNGKYMLKLKIENPQIRLKPIL